MAEAVDEVWISARQTLSMVEGVVGDWEAPKTICRRCYDGLIQSRAEKFIKNRETFENTKLPREFWWPKGEAALNQNWNVGDFDTWVERSGHWRAYAVEFLKADIDKLLPSPEEKHSKTTSVNLQPEGTDVIEIEYDGKLGENICSASSENIQNRNKGGRPMSDWWPDWVAELTLYLDEEGLIKESGGYKNQSKVIEDVASRLSEKGKYMPDRSTVQPVVRAVIEAHRLFKN